MCPGGGFCIGWALGAVCVREGECSASVGVGVSVGVGIGGESVWESGRGGYRYPAWKWGFLSSSAARPAMPAHLHSASTRRLRPSSSGHAPLHRRLAMACQAPASRCSSTVSSVATPAADGHVLARFRLLVPLLVPLVPERCELSRDTLAPDQPPLPLCAYDECPELE